MPHQNAEKEIALRDPLSSKGIEIAESSARTASAILKRIPSKRSPTEELKLKAANELLYDWRNAILRELFSEQYAITYSRLNEVLIDARINNNPLQSALERTMIAHTIMADTIYGNETYYISSSELAQKLGSAIDFVMVDDCKKMPTKILAIIDQEENHHSSTIGVAQKLDQLECHIVDYEKRNRIVARFIEEDKEGILAIDKESATEVLSSIGIEELLYVFGFDILLDLDEESLAPLTRLRGEVQKIVSKAQGQMQPEKNLYVKIRTLFNYLNGYYNLGQMIGNCTRNGMTPQIIFVSVLENEPIDEFRKNLLGKTVVEI